MEFKCEHCEKVFKHKRSLVRHKKTKHNTQDCSRFTCERCHASYDFKHELDEHIHLNHRQEHGEKFKGKKLYQTSSGKRPLQHTCAQCSRVYNRECDLQEHLERDHSKKRPLVPYSDTDSDTETPEKRIKEDCSCCGIRFTHYSAYIKHRKKHHQEGQGNVEEKTKKYYTLPNGLVDERLKELYHDKFHHIMVPHRFSQAHADYNFPTENGQTSYNEMRDLLYQILRRENHSFKLNFNFGLVIQNTEDQSYRYFYPLEYSPVLSMPVLISNRADIDALIDRLITMDLLDSQIKTKRPNTKYVFKQVANIMFYVYRTHYTLGMLEDGVQLPDYVKNSKSIVSLVTNPLTGNAYQDQLCFFRALALSKGASIRNLEKPTKELLETWLKFKCQKEFHTIEIETLDQLEQCFEVNVNVYQMTGKGVVATVRLSLSRFPRSLYLNLYQNHLSWVKNFRCYAQKYKCSLCEKLFRTQKDLKRHYNSNCSKLTKKTFKGGFYEPPQNLFEQLNQQGFTTASESQFFPFFAFYDFESILDTSASRKTGENTQVYSAHKPISFALASNVCSDECWHPLGESCGLCECFKETQCIIDSDPKSLVGKFIEILKKHQTASQKYMREKFKDTLTSLEEQIVSAQKKVEVLKAKQKTEETELDRILGNDSPTKTDSEASLDSFDLEFERLMNGPAVWDKSDSESLWSEEEQVSLSDAPGLSCWQDKTTALLRIESSRLRQLKVLQEKLTLYTDSLPVFGFNSAKYDTNLILGELVRSLEIDQQKAPSVIKRDQTYQLIQTQHFRFLDVSAFLAPNISYAKFLKMYNSAEQKFFFPYEFLDDLKKLDYDRLPSIEHFYSKLKGRNSLGETEREIQENYRLVQFVWKRENMSTLADLLIYYNKIDVTPGITALKTMISFYKEERNVDMLKSAISLPGISRKLLFSTAKEQNAYFYSFSKNEETIYNTFKKSITGGLSQVFHRYSEEGKTFIRNNPDRPVGVVKGWDSNSLYLFCLAKKAPTGRMIHRKLEKGFKPNCEIKQFYSIDFLDYTAMKRGIFIQHKANLGEHRVGPFMLDGFSQSSDPNDHSKGIIFEVEGCAVHFHNTGNCPIVSKIKSQKWKAAGPKRYERTMERNNYLRHLGYEVISTWECEIDAMRKHDPEFKKFLEKRWRSVLKRNPTNQDILSSVLSKELYGFLSVDIQIPHEWNQVVRERPDYETRFRFITPYNFFKEMAPFFMNIRLDYENFSPRMKQHIEENNLSKLPREFLTTGMKAEKLLLNSELLRFYLQYGMEVTKIYDVYEFEGQPVFKTFQEQITAERRCGCDNARKTTTKLIGVGLFFNTGIYIF